jgi:hypothetical protein
MLRMIFQIALMSVAIAAAAQTAAEECFCGTDVAPELAEQPVYAEDPWVEPGYDYVSVVEAATDVGVDKTNGECVIYNTFADDPGDVPVYDELGFEVKALRYTTEDGQTLYLTIAEVSDRARAICERENESQTAIASS